MEEIRGQSVYSKYIAQLSRGEEGSSWTSTGHNRAVRGKESVQIGNVRGEQIKKHIGLYVINFPSVFELLANIFTEVGISCCTQHTQICAAEKE